MGISNKFHNNLKEQESSKIKQIKISIEGRFSASENESGSEKIYNIKHLKITLFKGFSYLVLLAIILIFSNSEYSRHYGSTPSSWTCKPFLDRFMLNSIYVLLGTIFIDVMLIIILALEGTIVDNDDLISREPSCVEDSSLLLEKEDIITEE